MPLPPYGSTKNLIGSSNWNLHNADAPFLSGGTYPRGGTPPTTVVNNPNPQIQANTPSGVYVGAGPSRTPSFGNDQVFYRGGGGPQIPTLEPPAGVPQGNSQPRIELPDAFKLNTAIAGPSIMPPLSIRNGINMPAVTPGVKPQTFPSMNWSDFLTVAHNSYPR